MGRRKGSESETGDFPLSYNNAKNTVCCLLDLPEFTSLEANEVMITRYAKRISIILDQIINNFSDNLSFHQSIRLQKTEHLGTKELTSW